MSEAPPFSLGPPVQLALAVQSERRDRGGLRRVRDMRFAEIAYRGWQEASLWLERGTPVELPEHSDALLRAHAPDLADPDAALRIIRDVAPARFFAGAGDPSLAARFPLWDAAAGPAEAGPHIESGPHVWVDSADASRRLIASCWTLMTHRQAPAATTPWLSGLLASIWLDATHVRRYLSHQCSPNNGLNTEALALFYAGTLLPEFDDGSRWRDVAMRLLVADSETQIHPDGVHFEQSTWHQRRAIDTYLHFLVLAGRNHVTVPPAVVDRVQRMVEFLLALRHPDGTMPAIGDDEGAGLLPPSDRGPQDCRGLFAVAAALFRRRDFAWAADGETPEVAWLLGDEGVRAFHALRPAPPASSPSRVFPSGGYAVMRSGWDDAAHQMIVDVGPLGSPVGGSHGHADLLSVQCAIFGQPCLVDAGTYSYAEPSEWRAFFRSTAAHSTVIVDGASQATPAGPFGWKRQPRVRLREWHSTPEFDFLDAEHNGYASLPDPVVHRRRVIFVKPGYWILVDDLSGAARHQIDLTFQFAPLALTLEAHPWARAQTPAGPVLWVSSFPSAPVHPTVTCGQTTPISGWVSPENGRREAAPKLIYTFAVALPWRIVTLLLPDRQGLTSPPSVKAIYDEAGVPTGVAFERPRRVVRFDDNVVSVERE